MPDHQQSQTTQSSSSSSSSSTQRSGGNSSSGAGNQANLEQVVVYLAQNNTNHEKDEIPETLAALKKADELGLGKKSLLPISDTFGNGQGGL